MTESRSQRESFHAQLCMKIFFRKRIESIRARDTRERERDRKGAIKSSAGFFEERLKKGGNDRQGPKSRIAASRIVSRRL